MPNPIYCNFINVVAPIQGQELELQSATLLMVPSVFAIWDEQLKELSVRVGIWACACA